MNFHCVSNNLALDILMGAKLTIEDSIFDMKLKVRELQRLSRNRSDLSKSERNKAKFAMLSGDTEIAK